MKTYVLLPLPPGFHKTGVFLAELRDSIMGTRLQSGSGKKWNVTEDRFTARIEGWREEEFKDDNGAPKKSFVLTFKDQKGETFQRNSTTTWDRWFGLDTVGKGKARKRVKCTPQIKVGDVVKVHSIEQKQNGKNRFYNFDIEVFTGKDLPKWARR
jgi:hypothetical protein